MPDEKIYTGLTEDEIWANVETDFRLNPDPLGYHAVLAHAARRVILDIDIDPGGGFESGFEFTTFSSYLYSRNNFRFAIHRQDFTDTIGKFFGMQDVVLGYGTFDDKFVVKTNDEQKAMALFANPQERSLLESLPRLTFGIVQYLLEAGEGKAPFLELKIERGITDPALLKQIYRVFSSVLGRLD